MKNKIVRILLRVSSNQQLDADGDLSIQRKIVHEYINKYSDWILDDKEYFEGSQSGFSTSVSDRNILQQILEDAEKGEFDILVIYKDDRLGRRMWEIGMYVMSLKTCGVDIYTVKDGLISPKSDDVMGQMMLAMRYANAQKSSVDTAMRVKDTAKKLVQKGRYLGGKAPYGYELQLTDKLSKHKRRLSKLVILPDYAEVVKKIFQMSLHQEFGSTRIAKELNKNESLKKMAPGYPERLWLSGTITSILTNPIYAGYSSYNRRESVKGADGKIHTRKLDSKDWIISEKQNPDITIIDPDMWNRVQEARKRRGDKYIKKLEDKKDITVISRNDGELALIDVLHCGYCGHKMTNGSKYNYWTIKATGEKRASKIPTYKCQIAWQGVPHDTQKQIRADKIEPIIFETLVKYIEKLQENEDIFNQITTNQNVEKKKKEEELKRFKKNLEKIQQHLHIMKEHIPDAMTGTYPLTLNELVERIKDEKAKEEKQLEEIKSKEDEIAGLAVSTKEWNDIQNKIPTWRDIFLNADTASKRVLVDKIVERIDIWRDEVKIRFKFNLDDFLEQSRMSIDIGVPESRLRFYNHLFHRF